MIIDLNKDFNEMSKMSMTNLIEINDVLSYNDFCIMEHYKIYNSGKEKGPRYSTLLIGLIEIKKGSLEERVLQILFSKYPITVDELQGELGISKKSVERVIKGFVARGIVALEVLPDKSFIRLQRRDFRFIGRHESQRRALKVKKRRDRTAKFKSKRKKDDYDDMMYH